MNKLSLKMKLVVGFGALVAVDHGTLGGIRYMSAVSTESVSRTVEFNSGKKQLQLGQSTGHRKEKVGGRACLLIGGQEVTSLPTRRELAEKLGAAETAIDVGAEQKALRRY